MKTLHNQKGLGVVSMLGVLIAFGFISYFIMQMGVEAKKATIYAKSKNFYSQLDAIKDALLAYQVDKIAQGNVDPIIFTPSWDALTPDYLPSCSTTNSNAGNCRKAEHTPWGSTMKLSRLTLPLPTGFRGLNQIVIPLPPITEAFKFEHDVHVATLLKLPFAHYDSSANTITWQVRKIGEELQHSSLVKRSGDNSTLTGDWDVGGKFSITNAKDVTVRNSDGTQRRLGSGVVQVATVTHNTRIKKHSCPDGLIPRISTSFKGVFSGPEGGENNTQSISEIRSYYTPSGKYWNIGLDYYANIEGNQVLKHDGEIEVSQICAIK